MADDSAQEKTEEPTSKRQDEFREEGQIPKSQEITALAAVCGGMTVLGLLGNRLGHQFGNAIRSALQMVGQVHSLEASFAWMQVFAWPLFKTSLVFMGFLYAIVLASSLAQTGIVFSSKALSPQLSNLNPISGIGRLLSPRTIVQLLKNLLKLTAIGFILYLDMKKRLGEIAQISSLPLTEALSWMLAHVSRIVLKIAIFFAAISAFDYLYQWYSIRQKMLMSRQEIKEEMKESQLPEHVRVKVRQVAQERAKQAIRKEVPLADVIVTNPTHFAIALKYNRNVDDAPRVVAKGQDHLAFMIREIASEHHVPLYEYPELARSLYKKVKVGQMIPGDLYESVARVLAYIYRIHQSRKEVRA